MNKIILIGNLTKDPDIRETASGAKVAHFDLAVKRPFSEETDFFSCCAWRQTADIIEKYTSKGKKVCVIGYVGLRKYEDNKGIQRTAIDINVAEVELLSPKETEGKTSIQQSIEEDDYISRKTFKFNNNV